MRHCIASLHRMHLSAGKGILMVAALVGVGRGAVQRVKRELAGAMAEAVWPSPGDRWERRWGGPARYEPVGNDQSGDRHARLPPFANIWRGRVTTNSVNASTSLSTVIAPPCCFVTMS